MSDLVGNPNVGLLMHRLRYDYDFVKYLQVPAGNAEQLLSGAITDDSSVSDIYYAYMGLKNLGLAGKY